MRRKRSSKPLRHKGENENHRNRFLPATPLRTSHARANFTKAFSVSNPRPSRVQQWVEYAWGPYALAIGSSPQWKPSPDGCSAALEVEDFDAAVKKLRDSNVKFRMEPYEGPVCKMVAVFDPDGNTIVIHKRKGL